MQITIASIWVLIIINYHGGVIKQEFRTEANCELARTKINSEIQMPTNSVCFEVKGNE